MRRGRGRRREREGGRGRGKGRRGGEGSTKAVSVRLGAWQAVSHSAQHCHHVFTDSLSKALYAFILSLLPFLSLSLLPRNPLKSQSDHTSPLPKILIEKLNAETFTTAQASPTSPASHTHLSLPIGHWRQNPFLSGPFAMATMFSL